MKDIIKTVCALGYLLLTSCIIEDANVIVPTYNKEVVVNAFLTPDSLINVSLTHSINLDAPNYFKPIEHAKVIIYENGLVLDTLTYSNKGNYPALFTTKADFICSQLIFNQIQFFFINSYTQIWATIFLFGFSGRIYFVANYLKYTCIST